MSFLHPEFMYYMLPPLFILFGLLLTQKESHSNFFSDEVMKKLRVSSNTLTLRVRNVLLFLVSSLMVIALAQPVINEGTITIKAKSADIMVALDISDSMLATDIYPNRLEVAKQKSIELLSMAPNERIGIVAFAKNSYLVSPLSFDHGAVSFLLSQLDTKSITEKGTNFISLLNVVNESSENENKKYLLILSDGGDNPDFSNEIELAKKHNIVVFILGLGTRKGAPIKLDNGTFIKHNSKIIVSKLNENISELATQSGGVYIQNTTSTQDIKAMLSEIASHSEEKELKSEEVPRYTPLFYFPLGLALMLLLIAISSINKRVKTGVAPMLMLLALLSANQEVNAGMLDFMELNEAKEAYENKDYDKASKIYESHANKTQNGESFYNAGNAYYKQEKYAQAVKAYEKAGFENEDSRAKNFSNMGNAYAKQADPQNLQKAVEAYEKSLEIKEDEQTRENMQAVKKLLKKDEQKSDDEKKDSDEESKEDEKKSDDNKDSKDKSKDEKDKKENQDKSDEEKDSKDEKSEDEKQKSDEKKDKEKSEDKKNKDKNETKQDKKDKSKLEELSKDENNQTSSSSPQEMQEPMQMSDAEEEKWLNQLNRQQNTYMYMLNDQTNKEENTDEKPW